MSRQQTFTIDDLWRLARIGAPSLSPDEIGRAHV